MKQFDVFRDKGGALFVVLQNDLLEPMETVVVAPLLPEGSATPMGKMTPVVSVAGERYLLMIPGTTAIRSSPLKRRERHGSVVAERDAILDAVNLLYWGI